MEALTPSHTLSQRIWEAIPVAFLPPAHRHTVDITCRQSPFLSAGALHLAGLTDMREYPITDYLHDDHADLAQNDPQPGIIVGTLHDANSHATTDAYLQQDLHQLRPGGYLALVMPRTLLTTDMAPWMHTGVHAAYDILEVWYLATTGMTPPMVVLITQKSATHVPAARPVRVRTVQPQPTADTASIRPAGTCPPPSRTHTPTVVAQQTARSTLMSSPRDLTQLVTHLQQTKEHFAADTDIRPVDCYEAYTLLTSMLDVISGDVADMAKTLITLLCDFHSICQDHLDLARQSYQRAQQDAQIAITNAVRRWLLSDDGQAWLHTNQLRFPQPRNCSIMGTTRIGRSEVRMIRHYLTTNWDRVSQALARSWIRTFGVPAAPAWWCQWLNQRLAHYNQRVVVPQLMAAEQATAREHWLPGWHPIPAGPHLDRHPGARPPGAASTRSRSYPGRGGSVFGGRLPTMSVPTTPIRSTARV
ncbi:MAG: hypothetical protein HC828_01855 [Blastochloris sp.]|nr:hypothetical protein [Blastochloris sp.]